MRVHVLQNEDKEFIGSMKPWFDDKGYVVNTTHIYAGDPLPGVDEFDWLIIMGGSMSVYETDRYPWIEQTKQLIKDAINLEKRILGICLGGQLIASASGAKVYANSAKEIGWFPIRKSDAIAAWLPDDSELLCWHGDRFEIPVGATPFAHTEITPCQGFTLNPKVWALQFHLEVDEGTPEIFLGASGGDIGTGPYIQSYAEISEAHLNINRSKDIMHALLEQIDSA